MAVALPEDQRAKVVRKLVRLPFDGERASAGRMADQLVRSCGLTWHDVIVLEGERARRGDHREIATACLASGYPWSGWEKEFLANVQQRWRLTDKQDAVLRKLCCRAFIEDDF